MAIRLIDRYPNRVDPATSNYPHGEMRNVSAPGENDGTPLEQDWGNDFNAFFQALVEAAGITPDGNVDTVPDSQYMESLVQVANGVTEVDVAGGTTVSLNTDQSRIAMVKLTGTLTDDIDVIFPDTERGHVVINNTSGSFSVTCRTSAGSGLTVPQSSTRWVRSDGANLVAVLSDVSSTVDSVATLRTSSFPENLERLWLSGYYEPGDGGGGAFIWLSDGDKSGHDGGLYIDPDHSASIGSDDWYQSENTGTGVWLRQARGKSLTLDEYGVVHDGTDVRLPLRWISESAAGKGVTIVVPPNTYSIQADEGGGGLRGFVVSENSHWVFDPGAKLKALPTDAGGYEVVNFRTGDNSTFEFNGATIEGDLDDHTGADAENGFCVALYGSSNVRLVKPKCTKAWGDGIYITNDPAGKDYSEDIVIENPICDGNRRQGISVISARNLTITDPVCSNTSGTSPEAGIDFEPNRPFQRLDNIKVYRPKTENNAGNGIVTFMGNLDETTYPVSIDIYSHYDDGSTAGGFRIGAMPNPVKGAIVTHNPVWVNNPSRAFESRRQNPSGAHVKVINPVVIDCNSESGSDPYLNSAFLVRRAGGDPGQSVGGVTIIQPIVQQTDGGTLPTNCFAITNPDAQGDTSDINFIDPIDISFQDDPVAISKENVFFATDKYNQMSRDVDFAPGVGNTNWYTTTTNKGATSNLNFDLYDWAANSRREFNVVVLENNDINVRADNIDSSLVLYPDNVGNLRSGEIGSQLSLVRIDGGFMITRRIGDWAP